MQFHRQRHRNRHRERQRRSNTEGQRLRQTDTHIQIDKGRDGDTYRKPNTERDTVTNTYR